MDGFIRFLSKYANWKYVFAGLILIIYINTVLFANVHRQMKIISPDSYGFIDVQYAYTPGKAYKIIDSYKEEGIKLYRKSILTIDTPYPVIYGFTFALLFILMFRKKYNFESKFKYFILSPFFVSISDLLENMGINTLLRYYPVKLNSIAYFTSFFTTLKWTIAGLALISFFYYFVKSIIHKRIRQ